MKTIISLLLVSLLGLTLFFLNGAIGSWMDRMLFDDKLRLSKAYGPLEQGNMDGHEKALTDYVIANRGSKPLRALALYNLGVCALARAERGDPVGAKDAFFYFKEALRNDPLLFPAKFNLEILLRADSQRPKPEGEQTSNPEGDLEEVDEEELREGILFPPPFLGSTP
jgi:hypothetical protein